MMFSSTTPILTETMCLPTNHKCIFVCGEAGGVGVGGVGGVVSFVYFLKISFCHE